MDAMIEVFIDFEGNIVLNVSMGQTMLTIRLTSEQAANLRDQIDHFTA
jgi:hypothetical protein